DADASCLRSHKGQRHRRRRAGDAGHGMMLGHPEALVPESLYMRREIGGVAQRCASVASLRNGREVEDGKGGRRHPARCGGGTRGFNVVLCANVRFGSKTAGAANGMNGWKADITIINC